MLRLGLVGFTREQDQLIAQGLGHVRTALQWELVPADQADALCINGSRSRAHGDGSLEILAAAPAMTIAEIESGNSATSAISFMLGSRRSSCGVAGALRRLTNGTLARTETSSHSSDSTVQCSGKS